MSRCQSCGASIAPPLLASQLPKVYSGLIARSALLGIHAYAIDDDRGRPLLAMSRENWTQSLPLFRAAQLLNALEAISGRSRSINAPASVADASDDRVEDIR